MIRRSSLAKAMEILAALREGPLNSTRIAQRCNLNYGRLHKDLDPMLSLGWIVKETTGGHDIHKITPYGLETLVRYLGLWNEWERGVKLTGGQEGF